jgi:hypothetical protein
MSQSSHILNLPYIQPAQAQKHVTHNEAIRVLDALVQLSVEDRDQTVPPASPVAGDRHIVPVAASGGWVGQDGSVAVFEDAAWAFYPPQAGWQAVVRSEAVTLIWNGSDWIAPSIDATAFQNVNSVGINTTADATNRLAVSSDATLLSHAGSDHRVVVTKDDAADTASLLFQTGYSGRAEMGTAGSDDFAVKVSADATTWNTGVEFDAATGRATFPSGASIANRTEIGGRLYCHADNRWVTYSTSYGTKNENVSADSGTAADPAVAWRHFGALIEKDSRLQLVKSGLRCNSTEVTAADFRVYFQTGPWTTGWSSDGDVTRTLIGTMDNVSIGTGFRRMSIDLGDFIAPEDGFLLLFMRPIGTITATRYIYSSMFLNFLTPA